MIKSALDELQHKRNLTDLRTIAVTGHGSANRAPRWSHGYDRYGNRWVDLGGGSQSLYFNTANNRISGWSYDAAGNLLNDGAHNYTYDAEGKISKVDSVTAYTYDGEGQRVKKLVGENIRFVYSIGGQLIAEFDGSTGSLRKEYVHGGATLITIEPTAVNSNGTQYTTSDTLGSPRVITKSGGLVASRHDYMPFGGELGAGVGDRTTAMGFSNGGDTNRKKFTGYEGDTETGLDFAQARYYSNTQGRFTSPDPLMASAKATNPQSWNRYAYVGNNPMVFADPSGLARGPSQFHGNRAEIDHATEVGWAEVAEQEAYYEDRLAGKYDSIVETVEPMDGALEESHSHHAGELQNSGIALPTDQNDLAMLAVLLGEASTPGEGSWGPDEYGRKAYRNPSRILSNDDVFGEMIYMVFVVNNRLIDWGQREKYESWKDVIEKTTDFVGYENGKNQVSSIASANQQQLTRVRLALGAIKSFHEQPIPRETIQNFHYWKGIKQPGQGNIFFITKKGNAFRVANTDFSVHENRY